MIITLEAFVGMLFGSMCGAILYIKVSRIQSFAQIAFSDHLVVRYGSGLMLHKTKKKSKFDESTRSFVEDEDSIPCPVLEFRIANRMHNIMDGEIIDCSVNLVASIDISQALQTGQNIRKRVRRGRRFVYRNIPVHTDSPRKLVRSYGSQNNLSEQNNNDSAILDNMLNSSRRNVNGIQNDELNDLSQSYSATHGVDEEFGTHIHSKTVITKIFMESNDHPFFKRVWMLRHVLNEESPLLKAHTRELLSKTKGSWPKELNNYEGVRNSFHFHSLLISFSGTSNADANSVYSQHVYDFHDVNIGYTFCNMFYRDKENSLRVDMKLLNDIVEQDGGGGEPPVINDVNPLHTYSVNKRGLNRSSFMLEL